MAHGARRYGSLFGGFADGLLEAMRIRLEQDRYANQNRHWLAQEAYWRNKGLTGQRGRDAQIEGWESEGRAGWHGGSGGGGGGVGGNAGELKNFYIDQGYTPEGASAIVGNWQQENSLRGGGWGGDKGTSAGGFQWHDDASKGLYRGTGFMNWVKSNNLDVNDPMTSAKYSVVDLKNNYPELDRYLRTTNNVDEATQKFERDFEGASVPAMGNRLAAARTVYNSTPTAKTAKADGKGPTARTASGQPVQTDAEGRALDPKTGKPTQARADLPTNQLAGGTDEEAMRVAIEENQKLREQQDKDSPAPPPGYAAPQPKRSLPLDQQTQPRPPPPRPGDKVSTIPPGPTVAAQDTPFKPPVESGYPGSAQTLPYEPPLTTQQGPESPYAPPDLNVYNTQPLSPSDQPSSGVATSVHDPRQGPPQPPQPRPNVGITPSAIPNRPVMGPNQPQPRPNVGMTPSSVPEPVLAQNMVRPEPPIAVPSGRKGPAEVNAPLASGARDARSEPADANQPASAAQPVSATRPTAATPRVSQSGGLPAGVIRYEVPNSSASRAPLYTSANLSSLWGPNPPLSQRGQAAAAPPVAAAPSRQDDYSDVDLGNQIMGSAKGGPIRRYVQGGAIPAKPVTKFYGGGAGQTAGYGGAGGAGGATTYARTPGYATLQNTMSGLLYPGGNAPANLFSSGAHISTPAEQAAWNALTPDQQTWYTNALTAGLQAYNQPSTLQDMMYKSVGAPPPGATPAAPAPAPAAPAAPAPVAPVSTTITAPTPDLTADPSVTTGAGAPKLPTGITAKSYDPNVDARTGAGFANTANAGGTNYSVGSDDTLKQNDRGQIAGFQRGGIPQRPTMRFAAGGGAPLYGPGSVTSSAYSGPTTSGGWTGTPYDQMAPNQQAWADAARANIANQRATTGGVNLTQIGMTPAPIWPTAAPAAPAPIAQPAPVAATITAPTPAVDPNNQPGAGAPGLPDTPAVSPVANPAVDPTPAPIVDPTTTTVTNTPSNPVPKQAKSYDPTADTTGRGYRSSSSPNVGGPDYSFDPTRDTNFGGRDYGQIQGFDDGGGVNPAVLGMPPGLSGGQQPPPPIYYNNATYSGAGAPVGKGVTQNSVPTYIAGAIPTLPMTRGGVVRYADGGEVDPEDMPPPSSASYGEGYDMGDSAIDADIAKQDAAASAPVAGQPPGFSGYFEPATENATPQPATQQGPPPGVPAWTPEIRDDQGNPSRGFIAALTNGLHWLGEHLGLVGGAQAATRPGIASDPQTQDNRARFASGQNVGDMTPKDREEINNQADPQHVLEPALRNIAGMEYAYKMLLSLGRDTDAAKMAASILHYDQGVSQAHSGEAERLLYDGHTKEAVDEINRAAAALTDGRIIHATLLPDGQVKVEGSDLKGRELWKQIAAPYALLSLVQGGRDGSMQWMAYESQAAKYDSTFAQMSKARAANITRQQKGEADAAAQEQANRQIAGMGPEYDEAPPTAPATAPPALIPVTTPALPGPGAAPTTAAAPVQPPRGAPADSTGAAPTSAPPLTADTGGAPPPVGHGALPSAPAPADIPAPNAADVDLEHNAAYQNIVANTAPKYFTADMRPIVGGRPLHPPQPIDEVTLKSYAPQVQAAYRERQQRYQAAVQQNRQMMQADIDGQRRDLGADVSSRRAAATSAASDIRQQRSFTEQEKLRQMGETAAAGRTAKAEADAHKYSTMRALTPAEHAEKLGLGKGGDDASIRADYLGRGLLKPDDYNAVARASANDPTAMTTRLSQDYSPAEQNIVWQAISSAANYTHDLDPNTASELIGGAVNGFNRVEPGPPVATVDDGVARTMLTITRPDGTGENIVMRTADAQNLRKLYDARAKVRGDKAEVEKQRAANQQKEWEAHAPVRQELATPSSKYGLPPSPAIPPQTNMPF